MDLEQAYRNKYAAIAQHLIENSPHLKGVFNTSENVFIADLNPTYKGKYVSINTTQQTDHLWYPLLKTPIGFEIVYSMVGLGWRECVVWLPFAEIWDHVVVWLGDKPACDYGDPISLIQIPKNAVSYEVLNRTFYVYDGDTYFVNSDEVVCRQYGDRTRVLRFCLTQGLLPKTITYNPDWKVQRSRLNHWVYSVLSESGVTRHIVAWRDKGETECSFI